MFDALVFAPFVLKDEHIELQIKINTLSYIHG